MMSETKPILDVSELIKTLEESNKCSITSLYAIKDSIGCSYLPRVIAMAICNLQSDISILQKMEKEIVTYLLEELKNDPNQITRSNGNKYQKLEVRGD